MSCHHITAISSPHLGLIYGMIKQVCPGDDDKCVLILDLHTSKLISSCVRATELVDAGAIGTCFSSSLISVLLALLAVSLFTYPTVVALLPLEFPFRLGALRFIFNKLHPRA